MSVGVCPVSSRFAKKRRKLTLCGSRACPDSGNSYSILGLYRDNGKEHGNYYGIYVIGSFLGFFRDNGHENGSYYNICE